MTLKVEIMKKAEGERKKLDTLGLRGRKAKILLVEDNLWNQRLAITYLTNLKLKCDVASNGQEAIEAIERVEYDIVFMDIQMPVMDGISATKEIRKYFGEKAIIIGLTANTRLTDIQECYYAGMNGFLAKPVTQNQLCQAINKFMESRQLKETSSESKAGKIIDIEALTANFYERKSDFLESVHQFKERGQGAIKDVEDCTRGCDLAGLQEALQKVEGMAKDFSASELLEYSLGLRDLAEKRQYRKVERRIVELKKIYSRMIVELEEIQTLQKIA